MPVSTECAAALLCFRYPSIVSHIFLLVYGNWFQQIPRDNKICTINGQLFFNPINAVAWEIRMPPGNKEGEGMPIGIFHYILVMEIDSFAS